MNANLTEKMFLDIVGLKALIAKIATIRAEALGAIADSNSDIENLRNRLNAVIPVFSEDEAGKNKDITWPVDVVVADSIIQTIADYLTVLRNELGAKDVADKTVYERLASIEDILHNETAGLIVRVEDLEEKAYESVIAVEDKEAHKITVRFGSKNTPAEEGNTESGVGGFVIDTKDFVIDGMLDDVKLVTLRHDENKATKAYDVKDDSIVDVVIPDTYNTAEYLDKRFFLFTFATRDNGAADHKDDQPGLTSTIWVPVADLHDSYDYKAVSDHTDYVTLDAKAVHAAKGATEVTYTVTLTDKALEDFALVEGTKDPDLKGIVDLNKDNKDHEDRIVTVEDYVFDKGYDKDITDEETGDVTKKHFDPLAPRVEALEGTSDDAVKAIEAIENWINGDNADLPAIRAISVKAIEDYFDWAVYATATGEQRDADLKASLDNAATLDQPTPPEL